MKKILSFLLLCVAAICCLSCENGEDVNVEKKLVDVCFGVKFVESGSMSRTTADEVYQEFYNKHIATKELVENSYKLTIENEQGSVIATIDGTWDKTTIQLLTGKYKVTGKSTCYDRSKVSLKFDEMITVSSSETINLTAQYDCFLLLFPRKNATYSYYSDDDYTFPLPNIDDLSYLFMSDLNSVSTVYYRGKLSSDEAQLKLTPYRETFQIGRYYYFNIVTGTFTIPPMENGGI
ncbi:MAG: hypothetical protein E7141_07345 [Rikenellaceae bacterium]|nr:hypothetical protein [Rikenellaceae bacterium]